MVGVLLVSPGTVNASFRHVSTVRPFVFSLGVFRAYDSRFGAVVCRVSFVFVAVVQSSGPSFDQRLRQNLEI